MIFGVQYERFPNPRSEDWAADMKKIRSMGFKLIRVWLYWRKINPAEGIWDFSHYDRIFEIAQDCGLQIQIQLFIEAPPEFLVRDHPEWRYRNLDGDFEKIIRRSAQQIGGDQGFDYSNPEPRSRAEEYIRHVADRYGKHPALYGYDLWNELWMSQWLDSDWIVPERVTFLKNKYGSLEALNHAYMETFKTFEEVTDPRVPGYFGTKAVVTETYIDNMDALEFENYLGAKMLRWRAETLRSIDHAHPVMGHIGGAGAEHLLAKNSWEICKMLDVWGVSEHIDQLDGFLLSMQGCRDTAGSKPWWLAENGSGSIWTGLNSSMRSPEFLVSTIAMASMLNAQGIVFWQYRPEISGKESPNFGLVRLNGQDSPRSLEVARIIKVLEKHGDLLDSLIYEDPHAAIVYSPLGGLMERVEASGLYKEFTGWYAAFAQNGCLPHIIRDTDLIGGVPDSIRLMIMPMEVIEWPGIRESLLDWVTKGGILVASGYTFLYDRDMVAQKEYPGTDLFGVNEFETDKYAGNVTLFGGMFDQIKITSGGRKISRRNRKRTCCDRDGSRPWPQHLVWLFSRAGLLI